MRVARLYLKRIFVVTMVLPFVLFQFQNCGDVKFSSAVIPPVEYSSVSSLPSRPSAFILPEEKEFELRAVFVVDMSASMATTACAGEIDEDTAYDRDCTKGNNGSDPKLARLKIIETWGEQVKEYLSERGVSDTQFKAILIPFSAPADSEYQFLSTPSYLNRINKNTGQPFEPSVQQLNFVTIDKIKETAETLMGLQLARTETGNDVALAPDFELPEWMEVMKTDETQRKLNSTFANSFMQTSFPAGKISQAYRAIENELKNLRSSGLASKARFEIVYLSDGFQKPLRSHMTKVAETVWNSKQTYRNIDDLTRTITCSNGWLCYVPVPFEVIDYSATGLNCEVIAKDALVEFLRTRTIPNGVGGNIRKCLHALLDCTSQIAPEGYGNTQDDAYTWQPKSPAMSIFYYTDRSWGDFKQNTSEWISFKVDQVESLFNAYPEVAHRTSFIRVENTKTGSKPRQSDLVADRNWLVKVKEDFPNQRHATLTDGEIAPFSLFPAMGGTDTYQLGILYALNLNARVNELGFVEPDSDGDGLFDSQEASLNTDPQNRRSDGKCLDSVVYSFGSCPNVNCKPDVDEDGDGLNQCEELKLGSTDRDFDSDNDGIPDGIEVIYGYNPTVNDRFEDSDGNQVKNIASFQVGLPAYLSPDDVAENKKNKISVFKAGSVAVQTAGGKTLILPSYSITLHNLVRAPTLGAAAPTAPMYRDRAKTTETTIPFFLRAVNENTNQVIILGRMDNTRNVGDGYWIYLEKNIPYSDTSVVMEIEPEKFLPGDFLDPQGGQQ